MQANYLSEYEYQKCNRCHFTQSRTPYFKCFRCNNRSFTLTKKPRYERFKLEHTQFKLGLKWSFGATLDELEKHIILKTFNALDCNMTWTANSLGMSIRTLRAKMRKYGTDQLG